MLAVESCFIRSGSCSGFNVGKCCFFGVSKALRMPARGLVSIIPVLSAKTMTSLIRWHNRLTVSRLPLAAIGFSVSIALGADNL